MRIAIITPKRVAPKAHERNALKRLISSAIPVMHISSTARDVIIVVTASILKKGNAEIKEEINQKLKEPWVKS